MQINGGDRVTGVKGTVCEPNWKSGCTQQSEERQGLEWVVWSRNKKFCETLEN